jgi:hypothetical protein
MFGEAVKASKYHSKAFYPSTHYRSDDRGWW